MQRTTFFFIFALCFKYAHFLPFLEEFAIEEEALIFERSNAPTESKCYSLRNIYYLPNLFNKTIYLVENST